MPASRRSSDISEPLAANKPPSTSGLGLGDATVSLIAFAVLVAGVAYVAIRRHDIQPAQHPHVAHEHWADAGAEAELA